MTVQNGKYKPSPGLGLSLEDKIELSIELARIALECPTCRGLFKQAIENYTTKEGGPSIGSSRLTEGNNYNDNSRS